MDPQFIENMKSCQNPRDINNPNNPDNLEEIGKSQIAAVHRFLVAEVKPFNQDLIAERDIQGVPCVFLKRLKAFLTF